MARKTLILDTNVCINLAKPSHRVTKQQFITRINADYRVAASANTFMELLRGVVNGGDEYFNENRRSLQIMAGKGKPRFLPFGVTFALKHVLGVDSTITPLSAGEFQSSFETVLRADDKQTLLDGRVKHPFSSKNFGFRKHLIDKPLTEGAEHNVKLFEQYRELGRPDQTPLEWARELAAENGDCRLTEAQALKLGEALDGAYEYDKYLWHRARREKYDFAGHPGDWVDQQQLLYLCDKRMHFLTTERAIRDNCAKSSQSSRILLLHDVLHSYGLTPFPRAGKGS